MAARQVMLSINDTPIALNDFVQKYIDHVVSAILTSLRGTAEIQGIDLSIAGDRVSVLLNNEAVPLNPFAARIILSTMLGMVSSLKGVSTIEKMQVIIKSKAW
ncbi:MAG: hypothetical protein MUP30_12725 [Deltaproteobacteria bacterium]|nr:hypothetical protein [Deltaproteobacteria bacterium]